MLLVEGPAGRRLPKLLAAMNVVSHDELLPTLLALNVETVARDGRRGKAFPQVLHLPEKARSALGPRIQQAGFRGFSIAAGPAPLRPIGRLRDDAEGQQNQTETSGHVESLTDCPGGRNARGGWCGGSQCRRRPSSLPVAPGLGSNTRGSPVRAAGPRAGPAPTCAPPGESRQPYAPRP